MVTASVNISADLIEKPVAAVGSVGTKGSSGLADMLFVANAGLVSASMPVQQPTNPVGSSESASFFDLLIDKVADNSKKAGDISDILPEVNFEQITELAIPDAITAKDHSMSACIPVIFDTEVNNEIVGLKSAVVDQSLNQHSLELQPETAFANAQILPAKASGTLEPENADLFTPKDNSANSNLKDSTGTILEIADNKALTDSNSADQLKPMPNEPSIASKLTYQTSDAFHKTVDDSMQAVDSGARPEVKRALDINAIAGLNRDDTMLNKGEPDLLNASLEASKGYANDFNIQQHISALSSVRPDSRVGQASISTVETSTINNTIEMIVGQSNQVFEDGFTDDTFNDSTFAEAAQLTANNDLASSSSINKMEMSASVIVSRQITDTIRSSVITDDKQITIRLNPQELGEIRISFKSDQDEITGIIEVSKPELKQAIQSMLPGLVNDIQNSGVDVKKMTVSDDLFQQFTGDSQEPSDHQGQQSEHGQNIPQSMQGQSGLDNLTAQYGVDTQNNNQLYSDGAINILI